MSVFYCEGKLWYKKSFFNEKKGNYTDDIFPMYWCRGMPCAGRNEEIDLDLSFELWTIIEIAEVLETKVNEEILSFYAGWVNRMNEIILRLNCRKCESILRPIPFDVNRLSYYAVPIFHCLNNDCSEFEVAIRITHCINGSCNGKNQTIIDNRDCPQCSQNWLVCQDCIACCNIHHDNKLASCPKCGRSIDNMESPCESCGYQLSDAEIVGLKKFWKRDIYYIDKIRGEAEAPFPS